jgi:hypothetical protein
MRETTCVNDWPLRALSAAAVAGIFAGCGGTSHQATTTPIDQTPAYKQGYRIGYNAVLAGRSEDCVPRSALFRKRGQLKTKADVHRFVTGCNTGASDAVRTK